MVYRVRSLDGISLEKMMNRIDFLQDIDIDEDDKSDRSDHGSEAEHILKKNGILYSKYLTCQLVFKVL